MSINLEVPKKFGMIVNQAQQVATEVFRPISRKYDTNEHEYPKELDMLASLIDGMNDSGEASAGARGVRRESNGDTSNKNGTNMSGVLSIIEACWGDVAMVLSMPRQGLGNSAIASVANDEQLERLNGTWAAMAITEPSFGSDSAAIKTTAVKDGDDYVLNGEKIFVTSGFGVVHAMDAAMGKDIWSRTLGLPIINAPVVKDGRIFVSTHDNHFYAIAEADGRVLWEHQAITEPASLLASTSAAVSGEFVLAPFTSGELYAFRVQNGQAAWSDVLSRTGHVTQLSEIDAIAGRPVIDRDMVFATSQSGITVGINLATGDRVGAEALSRFPADWGKAPDVCFAEAHSIGAGHQLELLALDRAAEHLDRVGGYVAMNVSPSTLLLPA